MIGVMQAVGFWAVVVLALCALAAIQHLFVTRRAVRLAKRTRPVQWRAGFRWDWDCESDLPWQ